MDEPIVMKIYTVVEHVYSMRMYMKEIKRMIQMISREIIICVEQVYPLLFDVQF